MTRTQIGYPAGITSILVPIEYKARAKANWQVYNTEL